MEKTYPIQFGDEAIGTAIVRKQGLYWHICCTCKLTGEVPCRITMRCGGTSVDLGICIPQNGHFGLETRIPIKRIGEGSPEFKLQPKHRKTSETFIPVFPDEPFHYISRLKDAYLSKKAGTVGVVIREQSQDQRDSDLNP